MLILSFVSLSSCAVPPRAPADSVRLSHSLWSELLAQHVDDQGMVDYRGFIRDSAKLNSYLRLLADTAPDKQSRAEQIAYWINAYNAFTIKLVVDHYPISSIKDIKRGIPFVNSVWDIKWIRIGGKLYDLNDIEHGILRKKFDEPRIHFAINCASMSCPKLHSEAFEPDRLEAQLDAVARRFINDASLNQWKVGNVRISKIFKWYKGDFTKKTSLTEYINQYSPVQISPDEKIRYKAYNWALNEKPPNPGK